MLGNTTAVKQYFEKSGVQLRPLVSAEWNYNLVHQPYVTYSGTGINLYKPGNAWRNSGTSSLFVSTLQGGKPSVTSNGSLTRLSVNAFDISTKNSFEGRATTTLAELPFGANSYKIVFYARSIDTNIINLSTTITNSNADVSGSDYAEIDNFDWQKIEIVVGANPQDTSARYSTLDLNLDFVNTTLNKTGVWGIEVCNLEIYQISYFDYTYGKLWPTESVFTYFRPGESYITSGNVNIPNPVRKVTSFKTSWDNTTPCSPVVYSPRTLFSANANPLYKNGSLSTYSQYKYFVSERPNGKSVSIGASYTDLMDVNKIVLKFNVSQSIPNGFLTLYNGNIPVATVSISSNQVSSSGVCVLYYNHTKQWSTNKWAWSETDIYKMPRINPKGEITISQKINKIVFTQTSSTPLTGYTGASYNKSNRADVLAEFERLQVIEISPRLELDLSEFVLDYTVTKELDNKGTPLPISAMSANSAQISLSNIPLSGSGNIPLSVFSTNANNASLFVSPLKNLLVKNVKFYTNYYIPQERINEPSTANRIIPGGVFYADSWDSIDIKVTKVQCFDIIKFLQTLPVNDYVSQSQTLINVFTNIMDFAGFTDYDYDELNAALTDSNQILNVSYFFADSKQKTVYEILREAFLAYQIGATIDEYGILRFSNLLKVITKNKEDYIVNDENIVINSYIETIKTKIGKILMRYRLPQVKKSLTELSNTTDITSVFQQAPQFIWEEKTEDVVPFNYLSQPIFSASQNHYTLNKNDLTELFYGMTFEHNSYGIIEGEIISTGNKEILFIDRNRNINNTKTYAVSNSNEVEAARAEFANLYKTANIGQTPTGRFVNVERGLFGTEARPHNVMSSSADFAERLQYSTIDNSNIYGGSLTNYLAYQAPLNIEKAVSAIKVPVNPGKTSFVFSKETDKGFNTYSAKFRMPDIDSVFEAGLMFNVAESSSQLISSTQYQVAINSVKGAGNKKEYRLKIYEVSPGGSSTVKMDESITHIINYIFSNEPRSPLYVNRQSRFINLKIAYKPNSLVVYIDNIRVSKDKTGTVGIKGSVGSKFGFFARTYGTASTQALLGEIYACQSVLDGTPKYHFNSQRYLDAIVAEKRISEKFVMIQATPQIIGLNIYDVQNEFTPSLGAEPLEVQYNIYYQQQQGDAVKTTYMTVDAPSLSYSTILNSGFRSKFAVANNSCFTVFTKTSSSYSKKVTSTLALYSRTPIVLTEQQTAERILNPQNANEVIELQSDWLQSKKVANSIMGVVAKASDDFSKDISITLFGNPLIEVGDVVLLKHDLKNIKDLKFFVQSVKNTFSQGLTTEVVLNKISYTGSGTESLKKSFPQVNNLTDYRNVLGIAPVVGTTAGGNTVTISGGAGFVSGATTVIFDTTPATNVNVINSSTLTCVAPPHSAGFVNVRVIVNGITYYTVNYDSYEYRGNDIVLDPISQIFEVSNGLNPDTQKYEVALDWIQSDARENAFKWSLSNGTSGTVYYDDLSGLYKILFTGLDNKKTYTGSITTFYILNGAEIGKSIPIPFIFTTGALNVNPDEIPVITAEAIKNSSNDVTFRIKLVSGIADTYIYRFYYQESKPDSVHQGSSSVFTAANSIYGLANGWLIVVSAKNGDLESNKVSINYENIPLQNNFNEPNDPTGVPAAPIVSILSQSESGTKSSAIIKVNQDTSSSAPTSYTFKIKPSRNPVNAEESVVFLSNQFGNATNGQYTFTITGFTNGTSYAIETYGSNTKGNSAPTSNTFKPLQGGYKVSAVSISGNLTATWTGDPYFDGYIVKWTSDKSPTTKTTPNILKSGNTWKRSNTVISSNGTSFTDNYLDDQTAWPSGAKVKVQITPLKGTEAGTPVTSSTYTISGSGGGSTPGTKVAKPVAENFIRNLPSGTQIPKVTGMGGNFSWVGKGLSPTGTYTSWYWEWELYLNKNSVLGDPSSEGTENPTSYEIPSAGKFYRAAPVGSHYFRVRMVVNRSGLPKVYGAWAGTTGKFT